MKEIGGATTREMEVTRPEALERAVRAIGRPCVLKSALFGYDGKGQVRINADTGLDEAWGVMGADIGILEAYVDFAQEISVIVARGVDGTNVVYPPVERSEEHTSEIQSIIRNSYAVICLK